MGRGRSAKTGSAVAVQRPRPSAGAAPRAGRGAAARHRLGQYFTGGPIADLMASMMGYEGRVRLLDPGAGEGSLFLACARTACSGKRKPESVSVTAYEIDRSLRAPLEMAMEESRRICEGAGVGFEGTIAMRDVVLDRASGALEGGGFTHVIANPPYRKVRAASREHSRLARAGIGATNLYAAFVDIASGALARGGQITFITPRSFCNGAYFRRFRERFLGSMAVRRIHLFGSRTSQFEGDGVLQENVIVSAVKGGRRASVELSRSPGPGGRLSRRRAGYGEVVAPGDPQLFIHIPPAAPVARGAVSSLSCDLAGLGLGVSTGKVIDFRAAAHLRREEGPGAVPLVRPFNISRRRVEFPVDRPRHANFVADAPATSGLLVERGNYVLVKRFTTTEEKRRLVAAVWEGKGRAAFENRLNYFHRGGGGIPLGTARGLATYLNSSAADEYFRQFSGSTQVNAGDLRYLRYPSQAQLDRLGRDNAWDGPQERIDLLVGRILR